MILIAHRKDGRAAQLAALIDVEELIGVLVAAVEDIRHPGVPGHIESELTVFVEDNHQPGRDLEAYLHPAVVFIQPVAKGDFVVVYFGLIRSEILGSLIEVSAQAKVERRPDGDGEGKAGRQIFPIPNQDRNGDKVQFLLTRKEAGANFIFKIGSLIFPALLNVLYAAAEREILDFKTKCDASVQTEYGAGVGI